jgi:O-antigen/teichoic acid export membrane protein
MTIKSKNVFNKNVLTVLTGISLSQIFPIIISPLLTRLYKPEDFGFLTMYLLGVTVLTTIATGKYENSLYLPKKKKTVARLADLSFKLSVFFSCILMILIIIFGDILWGYFEISNSIYLLYILPFSVFLSSQVVILTQLSIKFSEYKKLSVGRVYQSLTDSCTSLVLGSLGYFFSGLTLVLSNILGQILIFLNLYKVKGTLLKHYRFNNIDRYIIAKKYIKFPLFMIPSGLINVVSANMPTIVLTTTLGLNYVGFYSLLQRTLNTPSGILGNSFSEVFKQQAAEDLKIYGDCRLLFKRTVLKLFIISIIPFTILFIYSPQIFELVFGEQWRISGEMAQILVPMFFIRFITMPVSSIILLKNKTEIDFIWQLLFLVVSIGAFGFQSSITNMMIYFSFAFSLMYLISFFINYKLSKD